MSADGARSRGVRWRTDVQNNTSESSEDHSDRQPDITVSCLSQDLENTRKKNPNPSLFHLQSGSNTASKNTWYSPIGICKWCCCSHIHSVWRKGCVLGLNRLVSLGTNAWMPLFSMWMTHQCALLALVGGAKEQQEGQWRDHSRAIVFALNMYQWKIMLHEVAVNSILRGDVLLPLENKKSFVKETLWCRMNKKYLGFCTFYSSSGKIIIMILIWMVSSH